MDRELLDIDSRNGQQLSEHVKCYMVLVMIKNRGIKIVNRVACVMPAGFSLHVED
jgi:hypothetical protein